MASEAITLTIKFLTDIKGLTTNVSGKIDVSVQYKERTLRDVEELLAGGVPYMSIHNAIEKFSDFPKKEETYNVSEVLNKLGISYEKKAVEIDKDNLLIPHKFYFHQHLQLSPPPPMVVQLPDGSFETSYDSEPFYLEIKPRFTIDDLLSYFYHRMGINESHTTNRDKGALSHLLKSFDVDFILHLIDEAYAQALDRGLELPKEPFSMQDYIEQARGLYEARKNTCHEEGLNRVIPRAK